MSARLCRAVIALALAPWLVFAPAMPQDHLHKADADHPQSIIHRHAEAHPFESHDHGGAEFDHGDEHVLWLSNASLIQSAYQFHVTWAIVPSAFEASRHVASWLATAAYDASAPHGPPRPSRSPRAPPLARRLI